MDTLFYISVLFIIVSSFVTTIIKNRNRDRCLKNFHGYNVTIFQSVKKIYGKLMVFSTGVELIYDTVNNDKDGHTEKSYIIYSSELNNCNFFVRFYDTLTSTQINFIKNNFYKKTFIYKLKRNISNVFASFRDSIIKIFEMFVGQLQKKTVPTSIIKTQDNNIKQIGKEIISYSGNIYEPIYESLIGKKVVLEINDENHTEFSGILNEYSADFIELLDTYFFLENGDKKKCDLIVPRKFGLIRHRG